MKGYISDNLEKVLHPKFSTLYTTRSKGLTDDLYIGTIILYHEPDMHTSHQWYLCLVPLTSFERNPIFDGDRSIKQRWGSVSENERIKRDFTKPIPVPNCSMIQLKTWWQRWKTMEERQEYEKYLERHRKLEATKATTEKDFYSRIDRTDNEKPKKKKSVAGKLLDKLFSSKM